MSPWDILFLLATALPGGTVCGWGHLLFLASPLCLCLRSVSVIGLTAVCVALALVTIVASDDCCSWMKPSILVTSGIVLKKRATVARSGLAACGPDKILCVCPVTRASAEYASTKSGAGWSIAPQPSSQLQPFACIDAATCENPSPQPPPQPCHHPTASSSRHPCHPCLPCGWPPAPAPSCRS